ncbi:hypothetical protein Peur_074369 [Populus x canadensis]|uniref:Uncharacterized protein n=1 Tax=Populus deltoides TaxID=3696 RepID=A0A8T2Y2F5_POPDE|nr:hypothetical protein H0E87_017966 [Populus deltoides]
MQNWLVLQVLVQKSIYARSNVPVILSKLSYIKCYCMYIDDFSAKCRIASDQTLFEAIHPTSLEMNKDCSFDICYALWLLPLADHSALKNVPK